MPICARGKMLKPYFETENGKLYHGDCLEIMPELEPVDLVLTDPPYGMKNNPDSTRFSGGSIESKNRRGRGKKHRMIVGDDTPFDPKHLLKYKKIILWGFTHYADKLPAGTNLVWIKRLDSAFGSFLSDAEIAWMNTGCGVYCYRDLSVYTEAKKRVHPNQKPVPLFQWCLDILGQGAVLDPYFGGGTTGIACERMNRQWVGIEISEKYCEIAAKRIEAETRQLKLF
jgi:DNA modification methylase